MTGPAARLRAVLALLALVILLPSPAARAEVLGVCNVIDPPPSPGGLNVPYKQVAPGDLVLDVYLPIGPGPFPAVVMAHGGGYRSGCKGKVAEEAQVVADHGFAAFNISYRLACDPADPPPDVQDPDVVCYGRGVGALSYRDMRDAVRFVRDHAADYGVVASQVALLGFSSGGGNGLMAAATGTAGTDRPDVVATWSGPTELGFLTDGVSLACELSSDHACLVKREDYVGCPLQGPGACPGKWYNLSPYTVYPADGPPVFIANGTREPTPWVEAFDLRARLAGLGGDVELCKVKGAYHATGYEDRHCTNDAVLTVFERTLAFIGEHLPPLRPTG